jgi:hypothetical protein
MCCGAVVSIEKPDNVDMCDPNWVAGLMPPDVVFPVSGKGNGIIDRVMQGLGVDPKAPAPQPSIKPTRAPGFTVP